MSDVPEDMKKKFDLALEELAEASAREATEGLRAELEAALRTIQELQAENAQSRQRICELEEQLAAAKSQGGAQGGAQGLEPQGGEEAAGEEPEDAEGGEGEMAAGGEARARKCTKATDVCGCCLKSYPKYDLMSKRPAGEALNAFLVKRTIFKSADLQAMCDHNDVGDLLTSEATRSREGYADALQNHWRVLKGLGVDLKLIRKRNRNKNK